MKKYLIVVAVVLAAAAFLWQGRGLIVTEKKVWRIGILQRGASYQPGIEGYRERMDALGYYEGKNVQYDLRFVQTKDEIAKAAGELVVSGVDLIVAWSTPATQAAAAATKSAGNPIPIIFGSMGDPLASGLVQSIQRPGMNVTGIASLSTELTEKRLELLKEINPLIKRVAMPHTDRAAGDIAANKSVDIAQEAAKKLGVELVLYPIRSSQEYAAVAKKIVAREVDGIVVGGDSLVWGRIDMLAKHAIAERLPLAAFDLGHVEKGALVGFGPDYRLTGAQAAELTHRIFRGGDPAKIPVEVPQKLMLIVNLTTARAIGVTLTDALLQKATVIIGE